MANTQVQLSHDQQPKIEDVTWPLVLWLEPSTTLLINGRRRELAAWARTFASALAAKADLLDADADRGDRDLAAGAAGLAALRAGANRV